MKNILVPITDPFMIAVGDTVVRILGQYGGMSENYKGTIKHIRYSTLHGLELKLKEYTGWHSANYLRLMLTVSDPVSRGTKKRPWTDLPLQDATAQFRKDVANLQTMDTASYQLVVNGI